MTIECRKTRTVQINQDFMSGFKKKTRDASKLEFILK